MAVAAPDQKYTTTITVKQVRVAYEGTSQKTGKPFVIYAVDATNEKGRDATLKTFDKAWLERIGQTVSVEYRIDRKDRNGQTYEDLMIVDPPRGGGQVKLLAEIRDLLKEQNVLLRDLFAAVIHR